MNDGYVNLSGEMLKERQCGLSIHNRAFKFGDSLFETIRVINGSPLFLEDHFSRLTRGMKEMAYDIPVYWDLSYFRKEILKVIKENKLERGGRMRFTVFRKGEGYYIPKSNEFGFIIEGREGETNAFMLNEHGLKLGIYDEVRIVPNKFSPFKTNNCITYTAAGIWARQHEFEDVLLLNDKGNIVEGISSNVFVFVDGILYTPSVKEGCVAGVMRKKIMQLAKKSNLPVIETSISPNVLEEAEEVFITNAISGVKWVSGFKKKRYFHRLSEKFIQKLNEISA